MVTVGTTVEVTVTVTDVRVTVRVFGLMGTRTRTHTHTHTHTHGHRECVALSFVATIAERVSHVPAFFTCLSYSLS